MLFAQEALQLECPVLDPGFTANEIDELLSVFQSPTTSQNSGSEGSNQAVYSTDERKRRRMISNRESARRSRWRKKRHLENLTEKMNQLIVENRDLNNRLGSLLNQSRVLWRENDRLMSEYMALRTRLSDLCHVLVAMQPPL